MNADVLVVGGGLAGLACATALAEHGLKVVVAEAERHLGGRAGSCPDEATGDVVDLGPHILLSEYPNLRRFLDSLGTHHLVTWDQDQILTLVDGGRVTKIRSSPLPAPLHLVPSLLRVPGLPVRDLLTNHRPSWLAVRAGEHDLLALDDEDALTFLRRMKTSRRLIDWFWRSTAMTIINVPLERCSTAALLRFYRILIANRDLKFGLPQTGLAELFASQASGRVEAAGGRVLLGSSVVELALEGGRVTGAVLADGTAIKSRFSVCAIPPEPLSRLLPPGTIYPSVDDLRAFEPSPYVSTYIWFERKLSPVRNWARTWSPEKLNYDFYDLSNIRPNWRQRPSVIAGNIIYSHRVGDLGDRDIIRRTVQEIAEFLPNAARTPIRHARVHRIPMAIPCAMPGMERRRPRPATSLRGLYIAGDWIATELPFCMESAVRSGWLAAQQVLKAEGRPASLALDVAKTRDLLRFTNLLPART